MARFIILLSEAIHVFQTNLQLGDAIRRIDATESGPRLAIKFSPVIRDIYITIRFLRFENNIAYFSLDGISPLINLNSILKLPEGITISGTRLRIQTDVLIQKQLKLNGIAVRNITWDGGAYNIDTIIY